jgi:hypothetical protein
MLRCQAEKYLAPQLECVIPRSVGCDFPHPAPVERKSRRYILFTAIIPVYNASAKIGTTIESLIS